MFWTIWLEQQSAGLRLAKGCRGSLRLSVAGCDIRNVSGYSIIKRSSIQIPNQKVCCCVNRPRKIFRSIDVL